MLLYCPNCQNLIDKVNENKEEGETIERKCNKCKANIRYYIKYKAYSKIIKFDK